MHKNDSVAGLLHLYLNTLLSEILAAQYVATKQAQTAKRMLGRNWANRLPLRGSSQLRRPAMGGLVW